MPSHKIKKAQSNGAEGATQTHPTTGSYLLSLELENVRCFSEKQVLDLSDGQGRPARWTILLGENGTGKTTVLQLLAAFDRVIKPMWEIFSTRPGGVALQHPGDALRLSAPSALIEDITRNSQGPWPRFSIKARLGVNLTNQRAINDSEYKVFGGANGQLTFTAAYDYPMCYAYGTGRRLGVSSLNREDSDTGLDSLFSEDSKLLNAEEWLLRLDYSASKPSIVQEQQKKRRDMATDVLIKVLPDVRKIQFSDPTERKPTPGVEFLTPYGWVPLRQLGYGYRTMIAWVIDFTSRMVERYPDSSDPLAEPAVVLVDEIDLHLHPKWQRELIGFLTERFPNTQFIVTAHSPLIVQAAPDANLVLLKREGDHVVIENNPETIKGWRVDQILTSELFGLETARPPDMEKLLLRRKELLTKSRLTKAEQNELAEVEAKLGPIPTGESFEQAKTMELIEKSLELLKKDRGTKP
jgi:AAA domain, putative AbiEii toxin, Type IV TA system/AAA domain